jgi:hypothetical protein
MHENGKRRELILCITSYVKGQAFLRQVAAMGCGVVLLTVEKHSDAEWPRECLDELLTMPDGLSREQITNTVTYLARSRKFDRIVALDEFEMEIAAHLREHMRIPGMGLTTMANFRDKLAMRIEARRAGALVPDFAPVLNYDDLRVYMAAVPGPWVLKNRARKPRPSASRKSTSLRNCGAHSMNWAIARAASCWRSSSPAISSRRTPSPASARFSSGSQRVRQKPPDAVMNEGGVCTTRTRDRNSPDAVALRQLNAGLMPALGLLRGVTHAEYIRAAEDGRFYFLEVAARVGGAFIAELVEYASGLNLWAEWARIEVCSLRGVPYTLPDLKPAYSGSVLCLARVHEPDTSAFDAPEVVYRMNKHHHAGLIVQSPDPERVRVLLNEYGERFQEVFCAVEPPPLRPTA